MNYLTKYNLVQEGFLIYFGIHIHFQGHYNYDDNVWKSTQL